MEFPWEDIRYRAVFLVPALSCASNRKTIGHTDLPQGEFCLAGKPIIHHYAGCEVDMVHDKQSSSSPTIKDWRDKINSFEIHHPWRYEHEKSLDSGPWWRILDDVLEGERGYEHRSVILTSNDTTRSLLIFRCGIEVHRFALCSRQHTEAESLVFVASHEMHFLEFKVFTTYLPGSKAKSLIVDGV